MSTARIAIVNDDDFRPREHTDIDEIQEEEEQKIASGEWQAYGVVVYEACEKDDCPYGWACSHVGQQWSLWGCVTDSGSEGNYDSPDEITNTWLRSVAVELLEELKA